MKRTATRCDKLDYLCTYDLDDISYTARISGWPAHYYFLSYREEGEEKAFKASPLAEAVIQQP